MRRSKGGARPASRVAPIHALFAAAALGLLVMPLALAGAKPTAAASGSSLRKQVKSLKKRVAALEARTTTAPGNNPGSLSGPAGGDLIGSYPNPQIRPNAISGFEIFDGSITGADIAFKSLPGSTKIASESLGSDEIANGKIGRASCRE